MYTYEDMCFLLALPTGYSLLASPYWLLPVPYWIYNFISVVVNSPVLCRAGLCAKVSHCPTYFAPSAWR